MRGAAKTVLYVAAALVFCSSYAPAQAAPRQAQHACTADDLVHGTWKMLVLREAPARQEANWVSDHPYHYLSFLDGSNYTFIASDRELKTPAEAQRAMSWPQWSNHSLVYRIGDQGVLDLYLDRRLKYHYRCVMIDAGTAGGYKKGDLILTAYIPHRDREITYVYKWYRRWY